MNNNTSENWYNSLYSDLWRSSLYTAVFAHIKQSIVSAEIPPESKRLIGILFILQRLQTILNSERGGGLTDLENTMGELAELISAGGYEFSSHQKDEIDVILTKNAVPTEVVSRIRKSFSPY